MLFLAVLCALFSAATFIRGEILPGVGAAVLAIASFVLFLVLRRRNKWNRLAEKRIRREKQEEDRRPKVQRPNPACPICYGQGLKSGNFTGDLVNCDCMEEDEE